MDNLFMQASKMGVTFNFKGTITVNDLWDLSQKDLDKIYRDLTAEQRAVSGDSLMEERKANTELEVKIEVVKAVFEQKKQDAADNLARAKNKERKERLKELLDKKQDEQFSSLPVEEIQKMIDEL